MQSNIARVRERTHINVCARALDDAYSRGNSSTRFATSSFLGVGWISNDTMVRTTMSDVPVPRANGLLARLPRREQEALAGASEPVQMSVGQILCMPEDTIEHVYFPVDSYVSLITPAGGSESLEVGMVGNEGMFGATLLLGVEVAVFRGLVQGAGTALRMSAKRFVRALREHEAFHRIIDRYMFVLMTQLAQTAACNRFHLLDARLARWLLMTHDRAHSNTFRITHEFLAYMLGVRRAGVTEAAGRLQAKGLIRYSRGRMIVLDRAGLEAETCPCYGIIKNNYTKHIGRARATG
jgi:CRP-like cAMP-binding protein